MLLWAKYKIFCEYGMYTSFPNSIGRQSWDRNSKMRKEGKIFYPAKNWSIAHGTKSQCATVISLLLWVIKVVGLQYVNDHPKITIIFVNLFCDSCYDTVKVPHTLMPYHSLGKLWLRISLIVWSKQRPFVVGRNSYQWAKLTPVSVSKHTKERLLMAIPIK